MNPTRIAALAMQGIAATLVITAATAATLAYGWKGGAVVVGGACTLLGVYAFTTRR